MEAHRYISVEYPKPLLIPVAILERTAGALLRETGKADAELSVLLVHDNRIAELNQQWLNRPGPTNVISFSQACDGVHKGPFHVLGDIVISIDTARREAEEAGMPLTRRIIELMVHGLAHLLGEDHEEGDEAAKRMAEMEYKLLQKLRREDIMADLCINVDHIATIREARGGTEPDPVVAAGIVELAGADGIVVHLREDRRHIQDRDVRLLRETVQTRLTLEMAATEEMLGIAKEIKPDIVTLVPEKREELTTEGGLNVSALESSIKEAVEYLNQADIPVSLFIDPEEDQIRAASRTKAQCIEIHTGRYSEAENVEIEDQEFEAIINSAKLAMDLGLRVHAGHGLNYQNTARLAAVSEIVEFSIGHAVISRAAMVGLQQAVRDMLALVKQGYIG